MRVGEPAEPARAWEEGALPVLAPGQRYHAGDEIGRGGNARVLRAHDGRLDRHVVIKELLQRDPHAARRFLREARITARLQHPGIVPVHDVGRWPGDVLFYTMKEISGRTLGAALAGARTLADRLALLPALIAAGEAVAYAHSRGVIHRDLKPANVIVGEFGETVVIDWGLAKETGSQDSGEDPPGPPPGSRGAGETLVGTVLGTPTYMPPEQARGEPVDSRADVYALGAILYHLLAGRPPYGGEGASARAVLDDVLGGIARHRPAGDAGQRGRHVAWQGRRRAAEHVVEHGARARALAAVRGATREQVIEDGTERVDVGPAVDRLAARLLGWHVGRRAEHGADLGLTLSLIHI